MSQLATATVRNPEGLRWPSEQYALGSDDSTPAELVLPIPFAAPGWAGYSGTMRWPYLGDDPGPEYGDYPYEVLITDAVPPYFEDMAAIDLAGATVQALGADGVQLDVHLIDDGLMTYETPDGDSGAWLVVAVDSDQYSEHSGWALCRFHLTPDNTNPAKSVYCNAADDPFVMRDGGRTLYRYHWGVEPDGTLTEVVAMLDFEDTTQISASSPGFVATFDPDASPYTWEGSTLDGVAVWQDQPDLEPGSERDEALRQLTVTWDLPEDPELYTP
ncbi:hypothetical protein ON058_00765 [Demequina sp. B12]|uniref:hypothetical protein n=1 Tax=Demequina sp. B12 TaxID=2992757 RepID=UPI00237C391F|nr:hypothetical protein [Demequina sp. B12]MDE0571944.1 hypothetical protein [Demequina sp. B12]